MGQFANTGLSILVEEDPVFLWSDDSQLIVEQSITENVENYSHENRALGGFYSAEMDLRGLDDPDLWFDHGLGREITVENPYHDVIWNGFVNKVVVDEGDLVRTRGPLLDITNSVNVQYTRTYADTSFPLVGVKDETGWIADAASVSRWGLIRKLLNGGEMTDTQAIQAANNHLSNYGRPDTNTTFNLGASRPVVVKLSLLGYWHWLLYVYEQIASTGQINLSTKLQNVLSADPNGFISTNFDNITLNTTQVDAVEDKGRRAMDIIKTLVLSSDGLYDRNIFGIYEDHIAYYSTIGSPNSPTYNYNRGEGTALVTDSANREVYPWDVRAGVWALTKGRRRRVGAVRVDYSRADPDVFFVESAKFSVPNDISLKGGKVLSPSGSIARYGLSGAEI